MRRLTEPRVVRSVSISYAFDSLCRQHNLSISEACRVGISLLLAEKGITDYDNNLNIFRKIQVLNQKLSETSQELYNLKEKWETQTTEKEQKENIK